MEWVRDRYRATDDRAAVDVPMVARFLATEAYWSPGIPESTVQTAADNSLCLSIFDGTDQVGFARIVTDQATFAYLCDVFVVEAHRGRGLGHWLAELAVDHPAVEGVRWYLLATDDAHPIYSAVGFTPPARPETIMEIKRRPQELRPPEP